MFLPTELLRRPPDNRLEGQLEHRVKILHLFVPLQHLLDVALADPARQLAMLLRPLPQLLPLGRVVGSHQIRCRFFCEDILDGKDLVEELELLLCSLAISLADDLSLKL